MAKTEAVKWAAAGAEISADRKRTWVALAGTAEATGRTVVHLQPPLAGTQVVAELAALTARLGLAAVGVDPRSPSATLAEAMTEAGLPVKLADTAGVALAHGTFADLLAADRLRIRGDPALDEAVRAAEARRLAGSFAPARYGPAADMAPLMASQLAVWALGRQAPFFGTWR